MKGDIRVRTAAVTTVLNLVLTVLKFIFYGLSGSLAVLAEAWHSFSDIGTSLMVFIALRRTGGRGAERDSAASPAVGRLELLIALGIGLVLAAVGTGLLIRFLTAESAPVQKPLVSGIVFLAFSLGSYFISRFESRIGEREGSIGLVADGMHARADMTASLLTGFSLIVYALGIDIDRWVAGFIAAFILTFALETIVNVALAYTKGREDNLFTYHSFKVIGFLLDGRGLNRMAAGVRARLQQRLGNRRLAGAAYRVLVWLPVLIVALLYGRTCLYSVGPQEQAVVERFGRPAAREAAAPGLHLKLPWPVDRVRRVPVKLVQELHIGNVTERQYRALLWTRRHGTEEAFISGDNNFFYPYITLHFRVSNVFDYLYGSADPRELVSNVAHHSAARIFAATAFYELAATSRSILERNIFEGVQNELDRLRAGVEVLSVNFRDIHPPVSVAESFERVIAGLQEKQLTINESLQYRNRVLPESRAEAARIVESARAYVSTRSKNARGESERFLLSLPATQQEQQLTRTRLYLQTLQDALRDKPNVILDHRAGTVELWSGFENLLPLIEKGDAAP